jgi:hypothetical protein
MGISNPDAAPLPRVLWGPQKQYSKYWHYIKYRVLI